MNENAEKCGACGNALEWQNAGYGPAWVCTNCGATVPIPPPLPSERQSRSSFKYISEWSTEFVSSKKLSNAIAWGRTQKPSTFVAFGMVACTILLPIGMCLMFSFAYAAPERGESIGNDLYMTYDSTGYPDIKKKSVRDAGILMSAFVSGLCCPAVPYVIIMLVLITSYVALRSAGL